MDTPNEFQPQTDASFRERVLRARAGKVAGVLSLSGFDLFEEELMRRRTDIRTQFPHFTPEETEAELHRRINRIRQAEEHGFYSSTPPQ